jgi:hypothetical protein
MNPTPRRLPALITNSWSRESRPKLHMEAFLETLSDMTESPTENSPALTP